MNKLSQLLGAAAVIAIAVVFILQFRPATGAKVADSGPRCLAEVHGTCIPTHVFQAAYRAIVRGGDGNVARQMHMKEQTATGLIEMQLLNDDAKRLGIAVSDDDVSREFIAGRMHVSLPAKELDLVPRLGFDGYRASHDPRDWYQFLPVKGKDKKFDKKQFEKMLRRMTSLSPTDFREWQTKELLASRMRDLIRSRARVSEEEVFEQFARDKSTATIDYVKFDYRWYLELVDASPKKVDAWVEKNGELLNKTWDSRKGQFLPECRVTRHLLVKLDDATASDEEKAAAHKKIDAAAERIKKGEDFAKVAKDVSDDTGSAVNGGDLGCVGHGQMVKPFEDAMFSLAAGQVSGVVQSQFGLHLVKVEQIAKDADAERIGRAAVAKELFQKTEVSRLAAEGAKEVLAAVRGGKTLKDATATYITEMTPKAEDKKDDKADDGGKKDKKKKGEKDKGDKDKADDKKDDDKKDAAPTGPAESDLRPQVETSLPFTMNGDPIPGAHGPNEVAKIAFGLKNVGDLPDDVVAYDGGFVVLQLKEKAAASRDEYAKNREDYMAVFRRDKGQEALVIYMKRLSANLDAAAKPLDSLTKESKPSADGEQSRRRCRWTMTASSASEAFACFRHHDVTLANGLPVVLVPQPAVHRAVAALFLRVGSRFESPGGQRHLALPRAHGLPRHAVARDRARSGARVRAARRDALCRDPRRSRADERRGPAAEPRAGAGAPRRGDPRAALRRDRGRARHRPRRDPRGPRRRGARRRPRQPRARAHLRQAPARLHDHRKPDDARALRRGDDSRPPRQALHRGERGALRRRLDAGIDVDATVARSIERHGRVGALHGRSRRTGCRSSPPGFREQKRARFRFVENQSSQTDLRIAFRAPSERDPRWSRRSRCRCCACWTTG